MGGEGGFSERNMHVKEESYRERQLSERPLVCVTVWVAPQPWLRVLPGGVLEERGKVCD